ncbi:MAG TPA: carbohydrate ABC transporter permease [Spirochaetia bacterium]|jgi:ABC-type glycerol-3-phosphate transport system permease component|nr:carbohydrate ABC transporter permease [Spirochaetia bacterium]
MTRTESLGRPVVRNRYGLAGVLATTALLALALVIVVPLILPWFFVFKTKLEFAYHPWALPKSLLWDNFFTAWDNIQIGQGFVSTLLVCAGAILFSLPPSALAGYVFAKYRSKVTEVLFYVILVGYFVPIQMVLIPLYRMNIQFGLIDTLPGIFLPMAAFNIPFWTLIYRSFFSSLPHDLAEAAQIDGAGHARTFRQIMLPLAAPATMLALILVFIGAWSDYFLSLIMLNNQELFTMQLRVAQFLNGYGTDNMPQYAAAAVIATAPTLVLYILGQRWILQGTLAGALKE